MPARTISTVPLPGRSGTGRGRHCVLLADEPTGNLDPATAETVFQTLIDLVRDTGLAALVATHNPDLAARMDRHVRLDEGRLTG